MFNGSSYGVGGFQAGLTTTGYGGGGTHTQYQAGNSGGGIGTLPAIPPGSHSRTTRLSNYSMTADITVIPFHLKYETVGDFFCHPVFSFKDEHSVLDKAAAQFLNLTFKRRAIGKVHPSDENTGWQQHSVALPVFHMAAMNYIIAEWCNNYQGETMLPKVRELVNYIRPLGICNMQPSTKDLAYKNGPMVITCGITGFFDCFNYW